MLEMSRVRSLTGCSGEEKSSEEQKQPFVEQSIHEDEEEQGQDFDKASATQYGCIAAIFIGVILSLACLISGIYLLITKKAKLGASISISDTSREVISLVINVILALCTDGMMFMHSVSLRWALYRERRLEFNTNVRLFTSARVFGPNSWYINLVALSCLILSYASTSVLFLSDEAVLSSAYAQQESSRDPVLVNATALVALGIGLAGQAVVATWCFVSSKRLIPTWSANPLNTALAAIQKGDISHRPGRCMLSVHQQKMQSQETHPLEKQGNMLRGKNLVRYVLVLLWSLALLAIAWPITIAAVSKSIGNASATGQASEPLCWKLGFKWDQSSLACSRNYVTLSFSPYANDHKPNSAIFSYGTEAVLCVLFVCLIQGIQTIALHCLELLVNLSRDEGIWRQAYRSETKNAPGTQLVTNPFRAAVLSWENVFLFISKALMHWIVGQSLIPSVVVEGSKSFEDSRSFESIAYTSVENLTSLSLKNGFQFDMVYSRLIIYAILSIIVATVATFLALRRPNGCQPAALGHLQTLADLVDDWKTNGDGRIWWGDKTSQEGDQGRHAGTCRDKSMVGPILCTAKYAGR